MILLTYTKDVVYQITASRDCTVDFQMIGGGGGRGGGDSYAGSSGYPGLITSGSIPLLSGETIYCALGSGGYGGASGVRASGGGAGGFALDAYSGGAGGNAGPSGWSGGGGGGGGASVIWKNGPTAYTNPSNILSVSPGGPGGGGGGRYAAGYGNATVSALIVPQSFYPIAPSNNRYSSFLNSYGIWNGNGNYSYEVYFPPSTYGTYQFELSADNYAALYITDQNLNDFLLVQTQGEESAYQLTWSQYVELTPGWKTVRIYAENWHGPASLAAAISPSNGPGMPMTAATPATRFWTTRNSYNPLSYRTLGRGGKGQDHQGDGGGAGGGGGGFPGFLTPTFAGGGGTGGIAPVNDVGAMSGNYGIKFLSPIVTPSDNTLLIDAGAEGLGSGGNSDYAGGAGNSGGVVFNSTQTDIKYKSSADMINVKEVYVKGSTTWNKVQEVYVRDSNTWKRVYGDNIPTITSTTAAYNNISGAMIPYPPTEEAPAANPDVGGYTETAASGGDGCKIICTKLHELGYLPDYIYEADEKFGQYLRGNDPYAYYGYVKWASVVVDWMEKDGPQCMFWIRDKEKRGEAQRKMAIAWARRIATPWAHHMAYLMDAEETDNKAGRLIMKTGMFISRMIGKYTKTKEPTKNVALGYLMWVTFGVFWLLAGVK